MTTTTTTRAPEERSIAQLLSDAMHQTADLVRQEIALAKAELSEKLAKLRVAGAAMAAGGVLAFAGLLYLLLSAVLGLDLWLQRPWLSALLVGGVAFVLGAAMIAAGRGALSPETVKPERTLRSLEHDRRLAAQHLS